MAMSASTASRSVHVGARMNDTKPVKGRLRRSSAIQGSFAQGCQVDIRGGRPGQYPLVQETAPAVTWAPSMPGRVSNDRGRDVPTTVLLGRHFAGAHHAVRR